MTLRAPLPRNPSTVYLRQVTSPAGRWQPFTNRFYPFEAFYTFFFPTEQQRIFYPPYPWQEPAQ